MPYTLMKFLTWGVAFFAVGLLTGWLLRSLRARSEIAAARAARSTVAVGEEPPDGDATPNDSPSENSIEAEIEPEPALAEREPDQPEPDQPEPAPAEREPDQPEPAPAEREPDQPEPAPAEPEPDQPEPESAEPELDLGAASAILGCTVKLNDLTLVDGIGPKIAELCTGIGVITWQALAHTEVVALHSMLDAAGSRYKMHDPSTWPTQAAFLAAGDWEGFRRFHDERSGDA